MGWDRRLRGLTRRRVQSLALIALALIFTGALILALALAGSSLLGSAGLALLLGLTKLVGFVALERAPRVLGRLLRLTRLRVTGNVLAILPIGAAVALALVFLPSLFGVSGIFFVGAVFDGVLWSMVNTSRQMNTPRNLQGPCPARVCVRHARRAICGTSDACS